MNVKNFFQVFDIEDKSLKPLVLKGVVIGEYRNDVFCKWYATQSIQIADFEKYICKRLENAVGYSITNENDMRNAMRDCVVKKGMTIPVWMESWMRAETREELLPNG
jgi:predicted methyltransferase